MSDRDAVATDLALLIPFLIGLDLPEQGSAYKMREQYIATLRRASDELLALRAFAQEIYEDWPEFLVTDYHELQELAEEHGLLESTPDALGFEGRRKTPLLTGKEGA